MLVLYALVLFQQQHALAAKCIGRDMMHGMVSKTTVNTCGIQASIALATVYAAMVTELTSVVGSVLAGSPASDKDSNGDTMKSTANGAAAKGGLRFLG